MNNSVRPPSKVFFGWWTVLALGITSLLGSGFVFQGFSVFFKPISAELGLSRAVTSIAMSIQNAVGGLIAPFTGWASDKYGPRRLILAGVIILSLAYITMFFINSLWSFLFLMVFIGAGFYIGYTNITDKAIINWFVKKSGIAINIKFSIMSLSGLVILPLVAWWVSHLGWRLTYIIAGSTIAVITIPLIYFFVKPHWPEYYGLLPDGTTKLIREKQNPPLESNAAPDVNDREFTLKQAMKTSAFWLLISLGYVTGLVFPMMSTHCVPFLTDRGISSIEAATMMGLTSIVSIPGRLITGFIVDRLSIKNLRFIMAVTTFIQAAGAIIFLLSNSITSIYAWFILYGFGSGATMTVSLIMLVRYYGRKSFGSITGLSQALQLPATLAAPIYVGFVYDSTGSYMNIITLIPILTIAAVIITCFISPPKPSSYNLKQHPDIIGSH